MKLIPKTKLKNQLALISALSKAIIFILAIFVIPWTVRVVSIRETDDQLIQNLDLVYDLIETAGIGVFIDHEDNDPGFGSYNILKEEYISIEPSSDSLLYEYIDYQERKIDNEIYDYRVISATISIDDQIYLIEIGKSLETIINFEKKLKSYAFYLLLLLLLISIFIDLSISQILLKPFGKIIEKLKNTQHPKQFDYSQIQTQTTDFNYLQDSIGHLMHQIDVAFDVEREFIGNVSHELLTPISIIRSKLDNFSANTKLSDEDMLKIFEAKTTLSRLTKMVRTLLLLSRIENKEYLKNQTIDLPHLIQLITSEFEDRAEIKQQSIRFIHSSENTTFQGNKELIRILISNLVSNAIKYTPENGNISLSLEKQDTLLILNIKDDGPGISESDLPSIFDRFKKFGKQKESFGLGLALVKQIADYHDIQIQVDSNSKSGTNFQLIF